MMNVYLAVVQLQSHCDDKEFVRDFVTFGRRQFGLVRIEANNALLDPFSFARQNIFP